TMATFRQEKDRSSVGADSPVKPKNNIDGESLGASDSTDIDHRTQHYDAYRAGYDYAYDIFMPRIQELENQLRFFTKHSVAQKFQATGFDGADSARKRSAQQFRHWYENHQERDAA